jgi:outer membrane protein
MNRIRPLFILSILLSPVFLPAQQVLDQYIREALQSNIALQRQELSYAKSLEALKEAKANFLPTLSMNARYSVARGGRAFTIPIGDLMNPVYSNLNLINSLNQSTTPDYPTIGEYPQIENEQVNFLRETEQETFFRMVWPVLNTAILNNQKIQANLSEAEKHSVDIYKRELIKEVKTAYFNYGKAQAAVELFENTMDLVTENVRTANSLFENHKVTKDAVYAAQAQQKSVEQQLAEAQKNEQVAAAFFNFLLNRDYSTSIETAPIEEQPLTAWSLEEARRQAFRSREEFQQLNHFLSASQDQVKMNKDALIPNLNLVVDYGVQGTNYALNQDSDFAMGSLVMTWDLVDFKRKHKVQQSRIAREEVSKQKEEIYQQIGLQVVSAFYELEASRKSIVAARAEVQSARQAFRLVDKKYRQSQANQVEFVDARTRLTNAEQNLIIAQYDYQIQIAEYERVVGTYELN